MAEFNPLEVIVECMKKCKETTDREMIAHYLSETLGLLQIDNPEHDALQMMDSAIRSEAEGDQEHAATLLQVWVELQQRNCAP